MYYIEKECPSNSSFSDDKSLNEQISIENENFILNDLNDKTYQINDKEEEYKEDDQKIDSQESTKLTQKKEKKVIFKTIKANLGRRNKYKTDRKKGIHTWTSGDDLRIKIRNNVLNYIFKQINELIKQSDLSGRKPMKKIKTNLINFNADKKEKEKDKILQLLDTLLKDIFSTGISDHHKSINKEYNKNLIDLIIKNYEKKKKNNECSEKDEQIYDLLNTKFDKMLNRYAASSKIEENLRDKYNEEEKKIYIEYLKNYKKNIEKIETRRNKK